MNKLPRGKIRIIGIVLGFISVPSASFAHHAFVGIFDMSNVTEFRGEITRLMWRNPHVRFTMKTADGRSLNVETNSLSILRRMDVTPDLMAEGDSIAVAGFLARNGDNEMWVNNILLSDGRELVTRPGVAPHWSDEHLGSSEYWLAGGTKVDDSGVEELGVFRVWSTRFNGPGRYMWLDEYPFTEAAALARDAFNPLVDRPFEDCTPKGMPWIMEQPYPVEFTQNGENILFHIEEYDLVRTIHLNAPIDEHAPPSLLGHSVGYWDEDDLVVSTRSVNGRYFDSTGIPQSQEATYVERFSLTDDGDALDYTITVMDPVNFTEPVTLNKQWVWRPGETVKPYECTNY
ncbi:MAG: DUF6152 family protein [Gammaproteobacteria bacterium]